LFRLVSWGQPEAPFEACEARAAKHLALEEFHARDLTLHWPMTPGQGDPRLDRIVIIPQPFGTALEGAHRTLGGAGEPGIELLRLLLAHERCKVLPQVDGLSDFDMLRAQLGEWLWCLLVVRRCTPDDQPSGLPCRQ
jgi:hypothetical protein